MLLNRRNFFGIGFKAGLAAAFGLQVDRIVAPAVQTLPKLLANGYINNTTKEEAIYNHLRNATNRAFEKSQAASGLMSSGDMGISARRIAWENSNLAANPHTADLLKTYTPQQLMEIYDGTDYGHYQPLHIDREALAQEIIECNKAAIEVINQREVAKKAPEAQPAANVFSDASLKIRHDNVAKTSICQRIKITTTHSFVDNAARKGLIGNCAAHLKSIDPECQVKYDDKRLLLRNPSPALKAELVQYIDGAQLAGKAR